MRILLADDEPDILALLKDVLMDKKYEVFAANNGAEALDLYKSKKPDMAILDVNMPKMTGLEVLKEIRKDNRRFPVILLTIQIGLEDQIKGYEAEADYYLPKPFEPGVLLAYVRAAEKRIHA